MSDKSFKVKSGLQVPSLTTAGPVVTDNAGNVTSSSTLPISQGGTGQTTAGNALNALLPIQGAGNINKYLQSNGTNTQWNTVLQPVYAADAPSDPLVGQVWIESDSSSDSFDPNIIRRKTITATAGQTTFTTDLEFIQGYEQVYFNGMLLLRTSDYTTPSNTSVVLTAAAAAGDIVEILSITNLNSINAATTTTNTFTGNQIVNARIGIGVSNPLNDIHIYKASGNSVIRAESAGSTGNDSGTLNLVGGSFSLQNIMYGAGGAYTISNGNAHYFGTSSASPTVFWTNSTERMRIDASGRIGIGTSSPLYQVHQAFSSGTDVNTSNYWDWTGAGGSQIQIVRNSTANSQTVRTFRIRGGNDFDPFTSFELGMQSNHPLRFITNDTERMRINSDGAGIITSPSWTFAPTSGNLNPSIIVRSSHYSDGSPQAITIGLDGSVFNATAYINTSTAGVSAATPLSFRISGTQRMRLETDGKLRATMYSGLTTSPNRFTLATGAGYFNTGWAGGLFLFHGYIGGNEFWDLVINQFYGSVNVISSATIGSPPTRTYALPSGGTLGVQLTGGTSGTYTIDLNWITAG